MNRMQFEYHPLVGYKFIANHKVRVQHESGGYFVKTNNFGFRSDNDFVPEKTNKKRILVFGDSFTAGDGVSNKFRYTDLLEKANPEWEVYNFGLPGSGTDQQYLLYREFAGIFDHDLLIISVLVENIRRVNARYRYYLDGDGELKVWMKPYFEKIGNDLKLHNTPVDSNPIEVKSLTSSERKVIDKGGKFESLRKVIIKLGLKELFQRIFHYQPVPEYNSARRKEWVLMKAILEKWIAESKTPVLLVPIPLYQHIEESATGKHYQRRFKEFEGRCFVHDPLADLKRYDMVTRRSFRFEKDVHLTPTGHEALYKSLQTAIRKIF